MKTQFCFLLIVSRQVSNNAGTPGTIRRKMKGHVRNKSSKSGGSGGWGNLANGSFKPGHKRNQSVLSKISKLSILTFGNSFLILFHTLLNYISWFTMRTPIFPLSFNFFHEKEKDKS